MYWSIHSCTKRILSVRSSAAETPKSARGPQSQAKDRFSPTPTLGEHRLQTTLEGVRQPCIIAKAHSATFLQPTCCNTHLTLRHQHICAYLRGQERIISADDDHVPLLLIHHAGEHSLRQPHRSPQVSLHHLRDRPTDRPCMSSTCDTADVPDRAVGENTSKTCASKQTKYPASMIRQIGVEKHIHHAASCVQSWTNLRVSK